MVRRHRRLAQCFLGSCLKNEGAARRIDPWMDQRNIFQTDFRSGQGDLPSSMLTGPHPNGCRLLPYCGCQCTIRLLPLSTYFPGGRNMCSLKNIELPQCCGSNGMYPLFSPARVKTPLLWSETFRFRCTVSLLSPRIKPAAKV